MPGLVPGIHAVTFSEPPRNAPQSLRVDGRDVGERSDAV